MSVPRRSALLEADAECRNCEFAQNARNAVGLAAQHAARTGHTVVANQVITTRFNPEPISRDFGVSS